MADGAGQPFSPLSYHKFPRKKPPNDFFVVDTVPPRFAMNRIWRYGVRTTFGYDPGKDEPMPDKVSIFGHDH